MEEKTDQNTCKQCGKCCQRMPCMPLPADLPKIAAFLKLSLEECLRKYFVLDYYIQDDYTELYFPIPNRDNEISRRFPVAEWSFVFSDQSCVFLTKENQCRIHEVKPTQGRLYRCWDPHTQEMKGIKKVYADLWQKDPLLPEVKRLMGLVE